MIQTSRVSRRIFLIACQSRTYLPPKILMSRFSILMRFRLLPLLLIAPLLICSAYYLTIGYYWGNSLDSDEAKGILFIAAVFFFFIKHWLLTFWMFLLGLLLTLLLLLMYRMYKPKKGNPRPGNQVRRSSIQPDERIGSFKELL